MATVNQVQALYISYFGRPADSQGLAYWTTDVGADAPLEQIANGFAATEEYLASIQGEAVQEIITDFYENLINRAPEAAGLNYWVQEVLSGRTTTQLVGLRITQAVDAFPADNADKIVAESKFKAANQWTTETGSTQAGIDAYTGRIGEQAGIDFLEPVISVATIPDAAATTAAVNTLIADNPTGQELTLTALVDVADRFGYTQLTAGGTILKTTNFKLDSDSQSVNADNATLQAADNLSDISTTDNDTLNVTATQTTARANVANIENVVWTVNGNAGILNAGAIGAQFLGQGGVGNDNAAAQATTFLGVKNFEVKGAIGANAAGDQLGLSALNTGASTIDTSALTGAGTVRLVADNVDTTVKGGVTDERVTLGTGADTVNLKGGSNIVDGAGRGLDTITHDTDASDLTVHNSGTAVITITASEDGVTFINNDALGGAALVASSVNASTSTASVSLTGGVAVNDTLIGGSANDLLATGTGAGAHTLTGNEGADVFAMQGVGTVTVDYGNVLSEISEDTGLLTFASLDKITGLTSANGAVATGTAGVAAGAGQNYVEGEAAIANYGAMLAQAIGAFQNGGAAFGMNYFFLASTTAGVGSVLFIDEFADGNADAAIHFAGIDASNEFAATDIIA